MGDFDDRVALVTGSSRGIGAAIARLLASHGARVAIHGRDEEAVRAVTAQITASGGHALAVTADVTNFEQIKTMEQVIDQELGPIDILVANAGGSTVRPGPIEDLSGADWRNEVDANLTATFLTIKAVLPGMKRRGHGIIVTMSSAAARRPSAQSPVAYAAAKAGIELLTKAVALQAGPAGVRANCVAPETILTERNEQQIPDAVKEQLRLTHPVQRLGSPDDVAHAVLYLASQSSSWVSGVTLDVAGGSVVV
jgi:3-oxoacyl-[acyl-carrier protein] reductase